MRPQPRIDSSAVSFGQLSFANGLLALLIMIWLAGCGTQQPELKPVEYVDLDRFMGDWYVIANIPTFLEKGAHNAVEN